MSQFFTGFGQGAAPGVLEFGRGKGQARRDVKQENFQERQLQLSQRGLEATERGQKEDRAERVRDREARRLEAEATRGLQQRGLELQASAQEAEESRSQAMLTRQLARDEETNLQRILDNEFRNRQLETHLQQQRDMLKQDKTIRDEDRKVAETRFNDEIRRFNVQTFNQVRQHTAELAQRLHITALQNQGEIDKIAFMDSLSSPLKRQELIDSRYTALLNVAAATNPTTAAKVADKQIAGYKATLERMGNVVRSATGGQGVLSALAKNPKPLLELSAMIEAESANIQQQMEAGAMTPEEATSLMMDKLEKFRSGETQAVQDSLALPKPLPAAEDVPSELPAEEDGLMPPEGATTPADILERGAAAGVPRESLRQALARHSDERGVDLDAVVDELNGGGKKLGHYSAWNGVPFKLPFGHEIQSKSIVAHPKGKTKFIDNLADPAEYEKLVELAKNDPDSGFDPALDFASRDVARRLIQWRLSVPVRMGR